MAWKKENKPEQFLLSITDSHREKWASLKELAAEQGRPVSELVREAVSEKIDSGRQRRALVLSPHTDDAELGCGGTIAKLVERGWSVHILCFSAVPERYPDLADEAARSGGILGATHEILDFYTRYFPRDRQKILQSLCDHSRQNQYELIFTPSTSDIHQDHGVVTNEALRAFRDCTLLGYELPWNNLEIKLNCFVSLEERHVRKKIEALECYDSQKHRPYLDTKFIRSVVRMRGIHLAAPYAEGFETLKVQLDGML